MMRHSTRLQLSGVIRKMLAPREGQGLVEFALVVPVFLLLIFAVIGFGILLENKIALNDAARNGARFAAAQPDLWSNSQPAAPNSIQGAVQRSGSTISILTRDITINYYRVGSSAPTLCGSYDANGASAGLNSCLIPGNLIEVRVTGSFPLPVPLISRFLPSVVTITTSATAREEQGP